MYNGSSSFNGNGFLSTAIPSLDSMLKGGIPYSTLTEVCAYTVGGREGEGGCLEESLVVEDKGQNGENLSTDLLFIIVAVFPKFILSWYVLLQR